MSKLKLSIPHSLGKDAATAKIKNISGKLQTKHASLINEVKEEWNGGKGKFNMVIIGHKVAGKVDVKDESVDIELDLPFAAALFKGKISSVITEEAQKLLK